MKIIQIGVPEYKIDAKPDYMAIGERVDQWIGQHFDDGDYVVRAIGSSDHSDKSLDEIVEIIAQTGTDKYDPIRIEVGDFLAYNHDFQGSRLEIRDGRLFGDEDNLYKSVFGDIIFHFYEHTPIDRGYPIRIDILIIYYAEMLEKGQFVDQSTTRKRTKLERYLYKFKAADYKVSALAGIVKIRE